MTLTTHAIVGAAIASFFPGEPALGGLLAFASHFALDAIPHWDYQLRSLEEKEGNYLENDFVLNRRSLLDLAKIALDFILGLTLPAIFLSSLGISLWLILLGALLGMLPDFLQFLYFKLRVEPFRSLQRFHHFIHSPIKLKGRPILGVILQGAMVLAIIAILYYI